MSFLREHPQEDFTQRELAEELGISLGKVNSLLKEMKEAQFLDQEGHLSELGDEVFRALSCSKCNHYGSWDE